MIRELGNVELFELCETTPKVQYSHCLLYWNQGIIYCTCGQFLVESESRRKSKKIRLDALSIPHNVIKKGRGHGARHVKTEEQKKYFIAFNAWKRCRKRVDAQEEHYKGIHDRFLRDQVYRKSQLKIGWNEQKCIEMDKLAQEDHTYRLSKEEFKRYQGQWYLTLNKSGNNAPMRLRPDFRAAVSLKNQLHRESGEEVAHSIFSSTILEMALFLERFLVGLVQKLVDLMRWQFNSFFKVVCCSRFRLQLIAIYCNRREVYRDTLPTSFFSCTVRTLNDVSHHIWLECLCASPHTHGHPRLVILCSLLLGSSPCLFPCVSPSPCSSLPTSTCTLSWTSSFMWKTPR